MNLTGRPSSYCRSCEGTWVDGADLEARLAERPGSAALLFRLRDIRTQGLPAGECLCPKCRTQMASIRSGPTDVEFCCQCGGTFLNYDAIRSGSGTGAADRNTNVGEVAALAGGEAVVTALILALS